MKSPFEPTAEELADIAGQCSRREWETLSTSLRFLQATQISARVCAEVATKILNRQIVGSIREIQQNTTQ